ncbi:ATP synthase subunit I [Aliikangiella sp. IMCC44359]|uniref:ATP synthase subunit I n=1 Tax=Aliikangiella sp. IMCC44359 TaxID=3459125 RepID=UPI00403AC0AB
MSQILIQRGFQQAKKLLLIQTFLVMVVACLGLLKELMVAIALLSGGLGIVLANTYFVYKAFSKSGAQASKQVVRAFYFGETVKIALSVGLLVIAFILLSGFELYALIGYIAALLCQWLTPVIIKTH